MALSRDQVEKLAKQLFEMGVTPFSVERDEEAGRRYLHYRDPKIYPAPTSDPAKP